MATDDPDSGDPALAAAIDDLQNALAFEEQVRPDRLSDAMSTVDKVAELERASTRDLGTITGLLAVLAEQQKQISELHQQLNDLRRQDP